jgi:hypothetical protein
MASCCVMLSRCKVTIYIAVVSKVNKSKQALAEHEY